MEGSDHPGHHGDRNKHVSFSDHRDSDEDGETSPRSSGDRPPSDEERVPQRTMSGGRLNLRRASLNAHNEYGRPLQRGIVQVDELDRLATIQRSRSKSQGDIREPIPGSDSRPAPAGAPIASAARVRSSGAARQTVSFSKNEPPRRASTGGTPSTRPGSASSSKAPSSRNSSKSPGRASSSSASAPQSQATSPRPDVNASQIDEEQFERLKNRLVSLWEGQGLSEELRGEFAKRFCYGSSVENNAIVYAEMVRLVEENEANCDAASIRQMRQAFVDHMRFLKGNFLDSDSMLLRSLGTEVDYLEGRLAEMKSLRKGAIERTNARREQMAAQLAFLERQLSEAPQRPRSPFGQENASGSEQDELLATRQLLEEARAQIRRLESELAAARNEAAVAVAQKDTLSEAMRTLESQLAGSNSILREVLASSRALRSQYHEELERVKQEALQHGAGALPNPVRGVLRPSGSFSEKSSRRVLLVGANEGAEDLTLAERVELQVSEQSGLIKELETGTRSNAQLREEIEKLRRITPGNSTSGRDLTGAAVPGGSGGPSPVAGEPIGGAALPGSQPSGLWRSPAPAPAVAGPSSAPASSSPAAQAQHPSVPKLNLAPGSASPSAGAASGAAAAASGSAAAAPARASDAGQGQDLPPHRPKVSWAE
eukprot:tig00021168_g19081.t1